MTPNKENTKKPILNKNYSLTRFHYYEPRKIKKIEHNFSKR